MYGNPSHSGEDDEDEDLLFPMLKKYQSQLSADSKSFVADFTRFKQTSETVTNTSSPLSDYDAIDITVMNDAKECFVRLSAVEASLTSMAAASCERALQVDEHVASSLIAALETGWIPSLTWLREMVYKRYEMLCSLTATSLDSFKGRVAQSDFPKLLPEQELFRDEMETLLQKHIIP